VRSIDPCFELSDIPQQDLFELEKTGGVPIHPSIVLASSGMMMEKTMSYRYAPRWLAEKKHAIFIVGYMDPRTPGYRLSRSTRWEKIRLSDYHLEQTVQCSVDQFRFTSHARRERLLDIIRNTKPKQVILVHGDQSSIEWMGHSIMQLLPDTIIHTAEIGRWIDTA
jgi:Cft2 family RNA processing exonuclease